MATTGATIAMININNNHHNQAASSVVSLAMECSADASNLNIAVHEEDAAVTATTSPSQHHT
jgi:hypothetical protein